MPCSASAGWITSVNWRAWRRSCSRDLLGDPLEHLGRRQAVGAAGVDPRLDLVVDPGDADHEELVEVGDEDRQELDPLHQRQRLVLGELQHAVVEVEPRQLAVDVQRLAVESRSSAPRAPATLRTWVAVVRARTAAAASSSAAVGPRSLMWQPLRGRAIAASSLGRSSTTSSPLAIAGQPALAHPRLRAGQVVQQ